MLAKSASLLVTILGFATAPAAQQLLGDLAPGAPDHAASSGAGAFVAFRNRAAFAATPDPLAPRRLFETDGTASGTRMLDATVPVELGAQLVRSRGDVVFYAALDPQSGTPRLWQTDGTPQGSGPVHTRGWLWDLPNPEGTAVVHDGQVFFIAWDEAHGAELWVGDGTPGSGRLVADLMPGPDNSRFTEFASTPVGLFFTWSDGYGASALGVTDGTSAGTRLFRSEANPYDLLATDFGVYYVAWGATTGNELHASNGTAAATGIVVDLSPGLDYGVARLLGTIGTRVVFAASTTLLPGAGIEPWISDGTPAGTRPLGEVRPGGFTSAPLPLGHTPGHVWFTADDGVHGREPWITDGTPAGTRLVGDLEPGGGSSYARDFAATPWGVVFRAETAAHGGEPWRADLDGRNPRLVADLAPGPDSGAIGGFANVGADVFFTAATPANGAEPWITDGTTAGTRRIVDLGSAAPGSDPREFRAIGTRAVFTAEPATDRRVFGTDGTPAGTALLSAAITPRDLGDSALFGGELWFAGTTPTDGGALFATDGTPAGTRLAIDLFPASTEEAFFSALAAIGNRLFFGAQWRPGTGGLYVHASDGTSANTWLLIDPTNGFPIVGLSPFVATGGGALVLGNGFEGTRLFALDGTPRGVRQLTQPSIGRGMIAGPVTDGTVAWFALDDAGSPLWRSDGSVAGTRLVLDAATMGGRPREIALLRDRVVFTVDGSRNALLAWHDASRTLDTLLEIRHWRAIESLITVGDRVLFVADPRGELGRELWSTDGRPGGTRLVRDLAPGAAAGVLSDLAAADAGAAVVFVGTNGDGRATTYRSDGTFLGTRPLTPRTFGVARDVAKPVTIGTTVIAALADPATGLEPWAVPIDPQRASASVYGRGCPDGGGRAPKLGTDGTPGLGNGTFAIVGSRARPRAISALAIGPPDPQIAPCSVLLAALDDALVLPPLDAEGGFRQPLPVPVEPALIGVEVFLQWLVLDPTATRRGFTLSNGLQLRFGRS